MYSSTTNSVSYQKTVTDTFKVAGQIRSNNAVYTSVNLTGASVTIPTYAGYVQLSTTAESVVSDPDTDAIISITVPINKSFVGAIPAGTSVTLTEASQAKTGHYLKFTSPVPYGKLVTVLHGFDK